MRIPAVAEEEARLGMEGDQETRREANEEQSGGVGITPGPCRHAEPGARRSCGSERDGMALSRDGQGSPASMARQGCRRVKLAGSRRAGGSERRHPCQALQALEGEALGG